jgi:hypothetical protein
MTRKLIGLMSVATIACVAGCGGTVVDPDKVFPDFDFHGDHGAIALNTTNLSGALTARALNQGEADAKALELCGQGCTIVLRFQGTGVCGVLATSGNGHFGVGSGNSLASATAAAMEQCSTNGGVGCTTKLEGCND